MTDKRQNPAYKKAAIESLIPYANNSRTHSDQQIAQVAASIKEFGFTNPVLVDGEGGIIAGHGRVMAARKLGLSEVPVLVLDHLTEAQKKAYVIADNKLALGAGWDDEMLRVEIEALQDLDFDLEPIGLNFEFNDDELFDVGDDLGEKKKEPKKTDDGFSAFEVVMQHENKLRLLKAIKSIKEQHGTESNEDALMIMVDQYAQD